ncbi:MAG TPA: hypothetical protein VEC35_16725 [Noviherbaspirillum sp.]|nr:hypothetical protein [Noviherbaspirillum sp.]
MHSDGMNYAYEDAVTQIKPELLVSAVLHLMSHYASSETGPCLKLGSIIERHLRALAELPDLPPVLRATCQQLSEQWANVVERTRPVQQKRGFFNRLRAPQPSS